MERIITFSQEDVSLHAQVFLGAAGAIPGAIFLGTVLERVFNRSTDVAARMNERVLRWLRQLM